LEPGGVLAMRHRLGSGETLTLPQKTRAAARLVPMGGPSSGMAHFQFTKGTTKKTYPRFLAW
jgi:hypothetical protein